MLTDACSYATCLEDSVTNAWTVDDCFRGRDFDFSKSFLPERIAGVRGITCLGADERRKLNQIRANSYCHLFAFVEEFIVPLVVESALREVYGDETRLWALLRFAEEEVKHQELMRRASTQFAAGFGTPCALIPGRERAAEIVTSSSPLCALLLTSMIEWYVQLHYLEHVRAEDNLDPLMRDVLRYHWVDESRHARLDSLLIEEVGRTLTLAEREHAVDELLEFGGAVDELLARQLDFDVEALERSTPRSFTEHERDEIRRHQARAYRWTFIVSGLEHPEFARIVRVLTREGSEKITIAARALAA